MDKDEKIAHMSMIQGIITRFGSNSFTLKTLAMTISAALLAFIGAITNPNWVYLAAGCLPVLVCGVMDAKYLKLERLAARHIVRQE